MGLLEGTAEVIGLADAAILAMGYWVLGVRFRVEVGRVIRAGIRRCMGSSSSWNDVACSL
jgi:hypothetical protein